MPMANCLIRSCQSLDVLSHSNRAVVSIAARNVTPILEADSCGCDLRGVPPLCSVKQYLHLTTHLHLCFAASKPVPGGGS